MLTARQNPLPLSARQARIRWRCRRGMKELDLLLLPFIESGYHQLTEEEITVLEALLEQPDPDLYSWLADYSCPLNPKWQKLCETIRTFLRPEHLSH